MHTRHSSLVTRHPSLVTLVPLLVVCAAWAVAGEDDAADLRFRIGSTDTVRYAWTIASASQSKVKDAGRSFSLSGDTGFSMTLALQGLPAVREAGAPIPPPGAKTAGGRVAIRIYDLTYTDKRAIDEAKTELHVAKGKVKYVENGKTVIDSENDIGLDRMADYQQYLKSVEGGEMRVVLDAAGRQSDIQGEAALVDAIKGAGAAGIFPILAGKEVKTGEGWEDSFTMTRIGEFKLARPAVVRSKMTFARWVTQENKKLAQIEIASTWENKELKGESPDGTLAEISQLEGRGSGTCLFDPAAGRFVAGTLTSMLKYRLDGERGGQTTGMDVNGRTDFTFKLQEK
jgi:hypothetical protein